MALTPSQAKFMLQAQAMAQGQPPLREKAKNAKKTNSARSNSLNMPL